jgi:hypothetical protein
MLAKLSDTQIGILLFLGGVAATAVVGWIAWARPRRVSVTYEAQSVPVVSANHPRLTFQFDGVQVVRLTKLTVFIHNDGPGRVNAGDCERPLRLTPPSDVRILDVMCSRPEGVLVDENGTYVDVVTAPLDPERTIRVDVLHTGHRNSAFVIDGGAISNVAGGVRNKDQTRWKYDFRSLGPASFYVATVCCGASLLITLLLFSDATASAYIGVGMLSFVFSLLLSDAVFAHRAMRRHAIDAEFQITRSALLERTSPDDPKYL